MKKPLKYLLIMMVITMGACQGEKSMNGEFSYAEDLQEIPATEQSSPPDIRFASLSGPVERKVIKTANVNMQVENLDSAKSNIDNIIKQFNAYVNTDNRTNNNYRLSLEMTIRVQQDQLGALLKKIITQASFVYTNNINAQDVTEEFVDLKIRLKNKRAVEEQYREILKKAHKVEDILKVENELRMIREEIEAKEGRLNFLNSQVNMSTIHLSAYQDIYTASQAPSKSFWLKMTDGFSGGWDLLKGFIIGVTYLWPFLLMTSIIIFLLRKRFKNLRLKRNRG
ncbi:DUF4349 domain-containing protein [Fulvivirga sp. 29W222]|uniref:DUF4349 domain-containing protein n=1 Tax=Fulvivirga marina TaxID=2494733 RepID=A0A937KBK1_9BACT|nr:DUF4349 domain-containing protein [Fulvivirga marina]MBL6446297.1 DUF4349 domain-containing protein [Fulvivirga marina]